MAIVHIFFKEAHGLVGGGGGGVVIGQEVIGQQTINLLLKGTIIGIHVNCGDYTISGGF